MKRMNLLMVILIVISLCMVSPVLASSKKPDVSVEITASEGITIEEVKEIPIEFPPEKVVPLLIAPKEVRDIVLLEGEWQEIGFQIFSPDFEETTVNLIALENGQATPMVRLITRKVAITKDNDFMAYPRIVVLQPRDAKKKSHVIIQFVSENQVLATADIFIRIPLADKYLSVNVDRGKNDGGTDPYYTELNISFGISTMNESIGIGWKKDIENDADEGTLYFNVSYYWK